jgi:membrane-bound metal-dependent hydrolase YbcI (DUF457 family)
MDPLTHALASYALKRSAFPRIPRSATVLMLIAGTCADIDYLSAYFGPSAFLKFYRTGYHSLLFALIFSLLITIPFLRGRLVPESKPASPFLALVAPFSASLLHLLLDLCQSAGVELFWPFSSRRFAFDWLSSLDLWIMGILLLGILLPMLSRLVTEEIGAKSKGPRGKVGASLSLAAVVLYIVLRFVLHGNAIAAMDSRSYRGESARRTGAFAEPGSPLRWHGIVETESALHDVEVDVGPGASFDPDAAITSYKPESSPALDAARDTAVARRFLQVARFPKATAEKTPDGTRITLRSFPYNKDAQSGWRLEAIITTDAAGKVVSQQLTWDPVSREYWLR